MMRAGRAILPPVADVVRALEWRTRHGYELALIALAHLWRRALAHVLVVAVTGSCGKSTTRALIDAVLSPDGVTPMLTNNDNQPAMLARQLLRLRPWSRHCVAEVTPAGFKQRLDFRVTLGLTVPRIGVVTNIGFDHADLFGDQDGIAAAKGMLIEALPDDGVAILNADDPRVLAMAARTRARVVTYGLADGADVRAEDVQASWPAGLSLTACHAGERHVVTTRLLGAHWVHAVLAAIATGLATGLPLATIARRLGTAACTQGRFSAHVVEGITFIRDDIKAPLGTIEPALRFMRDAQAPRKIVVMGTISDYMHGSTRSGSRQRRFVYTDVARQALAVADHVIFVGGQASKCLEARDPRHPGRLQAFYSVRAAQPYLARLFAPGDLVLLKGTHRLDRLVELLDIARVRAGVDGGEVVDRARAGGADEAGDHVADGSPWLVIGLGNAAPRFAGTRHNIGHAVLDVLVQSAGGSWHEGPHGATAWIERDGGKALCVKPAGAINHCGAVVMALVREAKLAPAALCIVHDDIQLAVGVVRSRTSGGHGGHRGVESMLEAFGTDAMHRVKVGVGQPPDRSRLAEFVVAPFTPGEHDAVHRACALAAAKVQALLAGAPPAFGSSEARAPVLSARPT